MTSHDNLKADVVRLKDEAKKLSTLVRKSFKLMTSLQEITASLVDLSSRIDSDVAEKIRNTAQQDVSENIRKPVAKMTFKEKGEECLRRMKFGWTDQEIAAEFDYSVKQIQNFRKILEMPLAIHSLILAGQISSTTAFELWRHDPERCEATLLKAAEIIKQEGGRKRITKTTIDAVLSAWH